MVRIVGYFKCVKKIVRFRNISIVNIEIFYIFWKIYENEMCKYDEIILVMEMMFVGK